MIFGQLLNSGASGQALDYYTPWFEREGNWAKMVADIIQISSANCTVTITVQTKNSEDSDGSISATTWGSGSITSTGLKDWAAGADLSSSSDGFLELLRFKITVQGLDSQEWVHMRMLNPSWQTN